MHPQLVRWDTSPSSSPLTYPERIFWKATLWCLFGKCRLKYYAVEVSKYDFFINKIKTPTGTTEHPHAKKRTLDTGCSSQKLTQNGWKTSM